jgi:hypothetical protein
MTGQQERMWGALVSLDSKTLLRVITDYCGMQLLDEDFAEFFVDEGLMEQPHDENEDEDSPEEDDYVVREEHNGVLAGIIGSKPLGTFPTHEEAQAAIRFDMKEHNYYPNVWQESDHGNMHLYMMG